jgi:diguanylate cyclase (GGDEF)-like protein/PAS domain S-box-containing protein
MNAGSATATPIPPRLRFNRTVALILGLITIALGIGVLVGWAFDIAPLKNVVPGLATMKANTAISMVVSGIAIVLLSRENVVLRSASVALAVAVIALAGLTLSEDLVGLDFGIDQFLFADTTEVREAFSPGRMPPATTFCLLLIGSALLLASLRGTFRLRLPFIYGAATAVIVIGGLGLIGHVSALLYGSRWWDYAGMAVHTTVGFVLLGCGVLALARSRQFLEWSLNRLTTAGFAIAIISLVAATALSYSSTAELRRDAASVARSQEMLRELKEVESRVSDLQSSQRGYIITGDERLLQTRDDVAKALRGHLASVRALAADNAAQQRRMDQAEPLIEQRREFGDLTIDLRRQNGFAAAQQLVSGGAGIELSRRIDAILSDMEKDEYSLLAARDRQSDATATATFLLMPLGVFLSLAILLTGLFLLNARAREQSITEGEMRASEAKYRQLVEQATDGIFVLDGAGRFVFVNTRGCELLGYREDELLGAENAATYRDADRQESFERLRLAQSGRILRYERMVLRKDGTTFPAEFSSRMLDSGNFQVIFHDISERRRAETQLRESEEKFRQIIEQASDGIFITDAEGNFLLANSRGCEMMGYTQSEILQLNGRATYVEEERDVYARRLLELRPGDQLRHERTVRRKDGSTFPADSSVKKLDNGRIQVMFHDITERRRAADELRESERRFSDLLGTVDLVSVMLDRNARVTYCNDYFLRLTGWQRDEIIGQDWFALFIPPKSRQLRTVFEDLLADLPQSCHHENEILTRSGERRLIRWNNTVLRSVSGDVTGTASIGEDITDSKRAREALAAERTLLRTLVDALPDVVFSKDKAGRFTMANAAAYINSGFGSESEMVGKTVFDLYPHDMAQPYHLDDMNTLAGNAVLNREELSVHAHGAKRWFLTIKVPVRDAAGIVTGLVGVSRDITERKEHEDKIARLNRIQAMLSGINSAIVRVHDRTELFREACRIAAMHGAFKIAWIGMCDASGVVQPQVWAGDGSEFFEELMRDARGALVNPRGVATVAITEQRTVIDNDITRNPTIDRIRSGAVERGGKSVIGLPLYAEGKVVGVLVMYAADTNAFDDEEVKLLEELAGDVSFALTFIAQREKVDYLAYYDTLTGLPNRTLFFDRLARQLARANRGGNDVGLVLLNVDRFRIVNDTFGRHAGDTLLKAVADRIKAFVREQDTVSRMSADTFAVAASGPWTAETLARFVEACSRALFSQSYGMGSEELRVSATAGVAVFPADAELAETLVANAEAALRSAKQQNVPMLFYGPEMNARAAESLRTESRLRRALEARELVLWYQPKIDMKTGKLTGFEALMRWNDPDLGMIPPGNFIPIMEQTGLILEAGNWALLQVARDCAGWMDNVTTPVRIAVNVSPLQLREKDFVAKVIDAAQAIGRAGGCLDLEITESVIMENVEANIPKLQSVRDLGVRIYIDDFGTGYSSLSYIAKLPIYSLKIDRSFVVGMTQNKDSLNIVTSVISLAHSLDLCVVAEGVESDEQADLLNSLSCDEYQGYLFGRPVPASEVPAVVKKFS